MQACGRKMQNHVMDLNISKILEVVGSLENIVCRCFGPDGGQVLFIKSTGDILITKDGKTILESLLLDHPVARMIVNSACDHYRNTGDGVKSFIVLLCSMLRGLNVVADKSKGQLLSINYRGRNRYQGQGPVLKRMSNLLMTFQAETLDHIIGKWLSPHFLSVCPTLKEDIKLDRVTMQATLDAYFCGKVGFNNRTFISNLASVYLHKCLPSDNSLLEMIDLVSTYFSELHTEVPGHPVENSRILSGLVLHRPFSVYCPAEGELRALIITEPIHQSLSESDIDFFIYSEAQLLFSQQYLRQRTEAIVKHFHSNQVKLILSSIKQPEIVLYYANQNGISIVDCLPGEEIDLVCRLTGVSPLSKPIDYACSDHLADTFLASCCKPILLGSSKYVHLILNNTPEFLPHCLVICGPVKGLTEQLVSSFYGSFIMLKQLFQPLNFKWQKISENQDYSKQNESFSTQEESVTWYEDPNKDSVYNECKLNNQGPITAQACSTSFVNVGSILPAGGTFEMLLHYYLCHFAKMCQEPELALMCRLVGDALLCIPKNIYRAKKGNLCFPFVYAEFISTLQSGTLPVTTLFGLESVSGKYQLVASVFHCISKLVTIDLIVAIKRVPPSIESESDDDL